MDCGHIMIMIRILIIIYILLCDVTTSVTSITAILSVRPPTTGNNLRTAPESTKMPDPKAPKVDFIQTVLLIFIRHSDHTY
jgi:hypothetical protein